MKSEKEKMLNGDFYNAGDEQQIKDRDYARGLTFEFNNTRPSEKEKRGEILKKLIIKVHFILKLHLIVIMVITLRLVKTFMQTSGAQY